MDGEKNLPGQFSDLQPWVAKWAHPSEMERHRALVASSIDDLRLFYDALSARFEEIAEYLDQYDLATMPLDARCLFDLTIAFVESAHPIELKWKQTDIRDTFPLERIDYLASL